jgi:hypothetical protein
MMRRILLSSVMLVAALWAVEPRLAAQKQGQLFIKVVGPGGTPVTDLQAGDVMVTEDGVECKTVKIEPIDWPIKLQVLVDNGKANTTPINSLRDGLKGLFDQIPDDVEMSLYTTSPQPRPIVKPTTDKQKLLDGINLIVPDGGAGAFFDALSEAASRTDKDKTPHFPVIFMVGSDFGKILALDRDYKKLQENIIKHAMTIHLVVMSAGAGLGSSGGGAQTEIGLNVTKLSGGRYENITTTTRLATLLPEFGKRIAESQTRQSHQYRITYERPANAKPAAQIGASIARQGTPVLTIDGHMP